MVALLHAETENHRQGEGPLCSSHSSPVTSGTEVLLVRESVVFFFLLSATTTHSAVVVVEVVVEVTLEVVMTCSVSSLVETELGMVFQRPTLCAELPWKWGSER